MYSPVILVRRELWVQMKEDRDTLRARVAEMEGQLSVHASGALDKLRKERPELVESILKFGRECGAFEQGYAACQADVVAYVRGRSQHSTQRLANELERGEHVNAAQEGGV